MSWWQKGPVIPGGQRQEKSALDPGLGGPHVDPAEQILPFSLQKSDDKSRTDFNELSKSFDDRLLRLDLSSSVNKKDWVTGWSKISVEEMEFVTDVSCNDTEGCWVLVFASSTWLSLSCKEDCCAAGIIGIPVEVMMMFDAWASSLSDCQEERGVFGNERERGA